MQERWRRAAPWVAILLLLPLAAGGPGWSSFQRDALNTGAAPDDADYHVYTHTWWTDEAPGGARISAGVVVPNDLDMVIVADADGLVRALDGSYGTEIWNHTMGDEVRATPAISGGHLLVVDVTGDLEMLTLETGEPVSSAAVGATTGTPTIHEGKLFIGNDAGVMKAYTISGQEIDEDWSFDTTKVTQDFTGNATAGYTCGATNRHAAGQILGAPAVFDQKVVFASTNDWVYAVDERGTTETELGQTTALQWIYETGDRVEAAPTIDAENERVLVGSWDGNLYALDVSPTGSGGNPCFGKVHDEEWTFTVPQSGSLSSRIHASPAVDGERAFIGAFNGRVMAVTLDDGDLVWQEQYSNAVKSSPVIANDTLVMIHDESGTVRWLRDIHTSAATLNKTFEAGTLIEATPAIAGDRLFISTNQGTTYALGQEPPPPPAKPDLVVRSITIHDDAMGFSVVVGNTGDADAPATTLELTHNDTRLEDVPVAALASGENTTIERDLNFTEDLHTIEAYVVPVEGEEDTANNRQDIGEFVALPLEEEEDEEVPVDAGGERDWILVFLMVLVIAVSGAGALYTLKKMREPREPDE